MEIEFESSQKRFQLKNTLIREVGSSCADDDGKSTTPHLQAVIYDGTNPGRNNGLQCDLTYFDKERNFLGFDSHYHWRGIKDNIVNISMIVSVPEGTSRAVLKVSESKNIGEYNNYLETILLGAGIALIVLIFNYLLGS